MKFNKLSIFGFAIFFTATSCQEKTEDTSSADLKQAISVYAQIAYANYEDAYSAAVQLQNKVNAFVASPDAQKLQECKDAWLLARIPYGQSEAFRFYGGPIDGDTGPEGYINAWPIDENFIDYVQGNENAGIINNPAEYPGITKELLITLNESFSETSIFTGYHAIEFLLWGQDFNADGPGNRPFTDYVTGGTHQNQERRGQYLNVVTSLLVDMLAQVKDGWKEGGAYRTSFLEENNNEILSRVFQGSLGTLCQEELSGERMFVAVDTQDQENEHSCFSDNTKVDIAMNFKGMKNIYYATYTRTDGTVVSGMSFSALAKRKDALLSVGVDNDFFLAEQKISIIPSPFDKAIVQQPATILDAVTQIKTLGDRLSDVYNTLKSLE